MDRKQTFNIAYLIVALSAIGLFQMLLAWRDIAQLSHTELMRMVNEGKVASVTITETSIQGRFKDPQYGKSSFFSTRVDPGIVCRWWRSWSGRPIQWREPATGAGRSSLPSRAALRNGRRSFQS